MENHKSVDFMSFICKNHGKSCDALTIGTMPQLVCVACERSVNELHLQQAQKLVNELLTRMEETKMDEENNRLLKEAEKREKLRFDPHFDYYERIIKGLLEQLNNVRKQYSIKCEQIFKIISQQANYYSQHEVEKIFNVPQIGETQIREFGKYIYNKKSIVKEQNSWRWLDDQFLNQQQQRKEKTLKLIKSIFYLNPLEIGQLAKIQFHQILSKYAKSLNADLIIKIKSILYNQDMINGLNSQIINDFKDEVFKNEFSKFVLQEQPQLVIQGYIGMISGNPIYQLLIAFLLVLSCKDKKLRICGSNSALILSAIGLSFKKFDLRGVNLVDTDLSKACFIESNLENSVMKNVNITSANFKGAILNNVVWQDMITQEVQIYNSDSEVTSTAFSPKGDIIASGNVNNKIIVFDQLTGQQKFSLSGHQHTVTCVVFSPEGNILASSSRDGKVKLWSVDQEEVLHTFSGHEGAVCSVAFSKDGEVLASGNKMKNLLGGEDKVIILWNVKSKNLRRKLNQQANCVNSLIFSPTNIKLASCGAEVNNLGNKNGVIILWDWKKAKQERYYSKRLENEQTEFFSVAISPIENILALGTIKLVILWNFENGNEVRSLKGHEREVKEVVFSKDGTLIASGSNDKTIIVWDAKNGDKLFQLRGHTGSVRSVQFSPTSKLFLISGSHDSKLRGWNLSVKISFYPKSNEAYNLNLFSISPNQYLGALATNDHVIHIWDMNKIVEKYTLKGHTNQLQSLQFSSNCQQLASISIDQIVIVWDLKKREEKYRTQLQNQIQNILFSSDTELQVTFKNKTQQILDFTTPGSLSDSAQIAQLTARGQLFQSGQLNFSGAKVTNAQICTKEGYSLRSFFDFTENAVGHIHNYQQ